MSGDFREIGRRVSNWGRWGKDDLLGRQVLAVVNFPPRQIGPFLSEVLVLGLHDAADAVVVIGPERAVPNGARMC